LQPPERSIVLVAFDTAPNAEEKVPKFRDMAALPLLGGEGRGEGERDPTTVFRCARSSQTNKMDLRLFAGTDGELRNFRPCPELNRPLSKAV